MVQIGYFINTLAERWRNKVTVPKLKSDFSTFEVDTPVTTRDGLHFIVRPNDLIAREIFVLGLYERPFLQFLEKHLRFRRTMLDVGANIGNHSVYLSQSFSQVVCFEPNPTALDYLKKHRDLNTCSNMTICEVGLGKENAKLPFIQDPGDNLGKSHFLQEADTSETPTNILEIRIGDQLIEEMGVKNIDFIKIDVEGFEPDVLTGLQETIRQHQPIVTFEFHGRDQGPEVFSEITSLLPGYRFFDPVYWLDENYSFLDKLGYRLRYGGTPIMREILNIEPRTYENIVALADTAQLEGVKYS